MPSAVHFVASATPSGSAPITAMRIYVDSNSMYTVNAASLNTYVNVPMGGHYAIVQAWDANGTVYKTPVSFSVSSTGTTTPTSTGVSVSSPTNGAATTSPVHFVASAASSNPITAIRIYIDSQDYYTVASNKLDTYVNVPAGAHYGIVQAWDSTGAVFKQAVNFSVTGAAPPVTNSGSTVAVSISPTSSSLTAGSTKQFSASVSGTSSTSVVWQVNGMTGGSASVGTISTGGLYTAPLTSSSLGVTVTARSYYDTTKFANASVSVAPTAQSSSPAPGYYVSTSGNDANSGSASSPWRTITHAASLAKPGMTIYVLPGTYYEAVKSSVSGTSSARIRFVSQQQWAAKIVTNSGTDVWTNNGSYVDIVGFDMSGTSANHGVLNWASYVRVLGNRIHDLYVPISGGCTNGGAAVDHAQYTASHNDTIGNVINNIGTATSGSCAHGIYMAMAYGNIQNNVISNTTKWGITTWHAGTNLVITNNTIFNNHGSGAIQIGQGDAGVSGGTDYSNINNNIMYNNAIGIELEGTVGSHNTYDHNLMVGNSSNWYNVSGTSASLTNTISSAPTFVNYQANGSGDYHLQGSSAGVNAGSATGAPNKDIMGGARPTGGAYDVGAFEYGSGLGAWPWF